MLHHLPQSNNVLAASGADECGQALTYGGDFRPHAAEQAAYRQGFMEKRIVSLIVAAMVVIVIGLGALVWLQLRGPQVPTYDADTFTEGSGPAVDSGARIEIEKLRGQIEALTEATRALERRLNSLELSPGSGAGQPEDQSLIPRDGPNQIIDAYAQVVLIANRRNVNRGVEIASTSWLAEVLGPPRDELTSDCQPMTNPRLADQLVTEQVGPVTVRMLRPAVESLRGIFRKIELADPDLYARINTAGALCVRLIRGSASSISTHSFGLSLDLNIDGKLDTLGDGKTQLGLTILADFFRNDGWYWGAGFSREDSMHFEVGRDLVEQWIAEGRI